MLEAAPRRARFWQAAWGRASWAAVLLAAGAQLVGGIAPVALGLILFALGLSHGAGDEQDGQLRAFSPTHAAAYLAAGAGIAGLFLAAPLAGLTLFLALSAWHFARSDTAFSPVVRVAVAGLAVGGSALFQPAELQAIFTAIVGGEVPMVFVRALAGIGLVAGGAAVVAVVRGEKGLGHAVVALAATALLHPVLAVGLVFLTAHAVPVQQRQIAAYGGQAVLRASAAASVVALLGAALLALGVVLHVVSVPLAVAIAFGLATPHMLTERLER